MSSTITSSPDETTATVEQMKIHEDLATNYGNDASSIVSAKLCVTLPKHVRELLDSWKTEPGRVKYKSPVRPGGLDAFKLRNLAERDFSGPLPWETQVTLPAIKLPAIPKKAENYMRKMSRLPHDINPQVSSRGGTPHCTGEKIAFVKVPHRHDRPSWLTQRLESCRSIRYELPIDKRRLENISLLQFLATFTRLNREQRIRYARVFKRFQDKKVSAVGRLAFVNLYPALNSFLANSLGEENFKILCECLQLSDPMSLDLDTFTAICALTDRLYWTSHLQSSSNTFLHLDDNRERLEFLDFFGLDRKLQDVSLKAELLRLLKSLA